NCTWSSFPSLTIMSVWLRRCATNDSLRNSSRRFSPAGGQPALKCCPARSGGAVDSSNQRTENRGQRTEDRGQRKKDRGKRIDISGVLSSVFGSLSSVLCPLSSRISRRLCGPALFVLQVQRHPDHVRRFSLALEIGSRQHLADESHRNELHSNDGKQHAEQQQGIIVHFFVEDEFLHDGD